MSKTPRQHMEEKFPSDKFLDAEFSISPTGGDRKAKIIAQWMRSQCLDIASKEIEERDKLLEELKESVMEILYEHYGNFLIGQEGDTLIPERLRKSLQSTSDFLKGKGQ